MREMMQHTPGKIYLSVLLLSIIALFVVIGVGVLEMPILVFGWITTSLLTGALFVIVWLVAYLIYFFKYWPYR
ncbi:MAG: hypothetical protein EA426_11620 [Spirochaetaceae bacterium]|nr:MAG: hypothetical protein EA426_11620 [Spirochaetaceae bacterium]